MMGKVIYIIKILRWSYFLSWYSFFLGFWISHPRPDLRALATPFLIFLSLGPIFYSGIYYLNDIFDRDLDKLDETRKGRPVASGAISVPQAYLIAAFFLLSGLILLLVLRPSLLPWAGVLLLVNLFYSLAAKRIAYVELIVNAVPHPVRFYLGILTAGQMTPHPLILTIFLFSLGLGVIRRLTQMERGNDASHPALVFYRKSTLVFLLFFMLLSLETLNPVFDESSRNINLVFVLALLLSTSYYLFFRDGKVGQLIGRLS